jgi:hypothetical protein
MGYLVSVKENVMTIQEAIADLQNSDDVEGRVAEDMQTHHTIYGYQDIGSQEVSVDAFLSSRWITRSRA